MTPEEKVDKLDELTLDACMLAQIISKALEAAEDESSDTILAASVYQKKLCDKFRDIRNLF